ncbi:MAG: DUF4360 domain-containing protein [Bdellovibrionales bacterium]|nr:DUF4360 domain-containing protein [Bdellovibrionales bacterium]
MKTKNKNQSSESQGQRWLSILFLLVGCAMGGLSLQALAQSDTADFERGQGAPADNGDSVFAPGVRMGAPHHTGNGCAPGTVSAVLSPDQKTLSMLFDNYLVQAGDAHGTRRDLKSCQITIPFSVPQGFMVSVVKLDYRGFHSIPANGFAHYDATYFFSDAGNGSISNRRIRRKLNVRGPEDGDFIINSEVRGRALWSACGRDFNLHINTNLTAMSNNSGEDTLASLDSIDANASQTVDYHLVWQACNSNGPGRPPIVVPPGNPGDPGRPGPPGRPPRFPGREHSR